MTRGYRVWDNENKSYNDPYSSAYYAMTQDGGLDFYVHGDIWKGADPGTYIVEWDTGLKDKNGKKIYEGDIVKVQYPVVEEYYEMVRYEHAGFEPFITPMSEYGNCLEGDMVEVIGNIHENPELLK